MIEITTEIREHMTRVLNVLHLICYWNGIFDFEKLRATGLSRAEVKQAIECLVAEGYRIAEHRFGYGLSMAGSWTEWVWEDYKDAYGEVLYERAELRALEEEQAAAVAEVKRQLGI